MVWPVNKKPIRIIVKIALDLKAWRAIVIPLISALKANKKLWHLCSQMDAR
jgi:hypothetical protein